jgi:hypothetical protein
MCLGRDYCEGASNERGTVLPSDRDESLRIISGWVEKASRPCKSRQAATPALPETGSRYDPVFGVAICNTRLDEIDLGRIRPRSPSEASIGSVNAYGSNRGRPWPLNFARIGARPYGHWRYVRQEKKIGANLPTPGHESRETSVESMDPTGASPAITRAVHSAMKAIKGDPWS